MGSWSMTGSLSTIRDGESATLLPSGKVLVAGGEIWGTSTALATAELYDLATRSFSPTWQEVGKPSIPCHSHTATLLPSGKVLVAGGADGGASGVADLYDPTAGSSWRTGDMNTPRALHTATMLRTGKVLVVGGAGGNEFGLVTFGSAEVYDPATHRWTQTGGVEPRYAHTASLLPDGTVLVAGGQYTDANAHTDVLPDAYRYTPATGVFTSPDR